MRRRNRKGKSIIACYMVFVIMTVFLSGCAGKDGRVTEPEGVPGGRLEQDEAGEKGGAENGKGRDYDLPVEEADKKAAREDCARMFELAAEGCPEIRQADASELPGEAAEEAVKVMGTSGAPVSGTDVYSGMENSKDMERFLEGCENGERGEITEYELYSDGRIGRKKFSFDGETMYLLAISSYWNGDNVVLGDISYSKVRAWSYTEKGWFFYELCVPEYPEVTEPVYSSAMIRVKPLEKECAQITEQYLKTIAYNGNNLFWTDWDEEHMEGIDYNGLFEYLCEVRGDGTFDQARYTNGIPGQEFEELMTSCLPVTQEELREYAAYDSDSGMYEWIDLGVGNRTLGAIVSCIPEVTAAEKNDDGTMTLTVDAVCESMADDSFLTHCLVIRTDEAGNVRYLSNKVEEGARKETLPEYIYRIRR